MQNTRRSSAAAPPSKKSPPERPQVIAGKYKLGEELGSGSFGAIFFASHIHSGQHVAVKLETAKAHKQRRSQLEIEYRLYRILQGHVGIPRIYWFGRESGCRALVMELLGPSLEDMFKKCKRLFSVKTVRCCKLLSSNAVVPSSSLTFMNAGICLVLNNRFACWRFKCSTSYSIYTAATCCIETSSPQTLSWELVSMPLAST